MTNEHGAPGGYGDMLASYFRRRRWFAGKGREFTITHVHGLPWLDLDSAAPSGARSRIEVVSVEFADGTHDTYQFPVTYRSEPDAELEHALVGPFHDEDMGDVVAYDAVFDKATMAAL